MTQPHDDEALREQAKQRVDDLSAETALGNHDPEGGGKGDPKEDEGNPEKV
jgi:hypothetical protein